MTNALKHWMPIALVCTGGMMLAGCQNWRQKRNPYPPSQGFHQTPMRNQPGMQAPIAPGNPTGPMTPSGQPILPPSKASSQSNHIPGQPGGMNHQSSGYRNESTAKSGPVHIFKNGPFRRRATIPPGTILKYPEQNNSPVTYYKPDQNAPLRVPINTSKVVQSPPPFGGYPTPKANRPTAPVPGSYIAPSTRPVQNAIPVIPAPESTGATTVEGPAPNFPTSSSNPGAVAVPGPGLPSIPESSITTPTPYPPQLP